MAKTELGTKRTCPETGRKFYDLNRDPIVSPYTGASYPLSYFEGVVKARPVVVEAAVEAEEDEVVADDVVLVPLEEADGADEKAAATVDDDDIEIEDDDTDDAFLPDDEESDDDVSDLIDGDIDDEEDT
ncbi:MAG: TIGR02300 family protein [Microvirga sp.]|nr:TIGR02300 family protein [Microvirga sp.]